MRRVVSCERAFCVRQIYLCACRWAELYAVWPWCFRRESGLIGLGSPGTLCASGGTGATHGARHSNLTFDGRRSTARQQCHHDNVNNKPSTEHYR